MSYAAFARYYDALTRNVGYAERADYLLRMLDRFGHSPGLTLDVACGTGSFTLALAERGVEVFGLDASPEMLCFAQSKAARAGYNLLFICQRMQEMELPGTVDTAVCSLDGINHLTREKDVLETFRRVARALNPGGYFLFDANTVYKHRVVLADNVFVYETRDVYCVWQNEYLPRDNRVGITLDFFGRAGADYHRSSEHFYERAYSIRKLRSLLGKAGMTVRGVFQDMEFAGPSGNAEKVVFAAEKTEETVARRSGRIG